MGKLICIGGGEIPRVKNGVELPYETKAIEEIGTPVYAISKHDKFYLDYGFQYDDADLIDNECKTCSEYNVICFPKVMVYVK
jgi:hypothetical protein